MVREIPLTQGYVALIDDEDYERVAARKWHVTNTGKSTPYAGTMVRRGKRIRLHRFLLDAPAGLLVDHRNRNGLDCRRENLRLATHAQNQSNLIRPRKGTYRGVQKNRRSERWYASISHLGKRYCSRSVSCPEEAARLYDEMARRLHGEFARLNFPLEGERAA